MLIELCDDKQTIFSKLILDQNIKSIIEDVEKLIY